MKRVILILMCLMFITTCAYATPGTGDWNVENPVSTDYLDISAPKIVSNFTAIERLQSKYVRGCKITYDTVAQVTVEDGEVMVSNTDGTTRIMTQNTADTTVTWADIDTDSEEASTRYYIYAVADDDDDKVQAYVVSASSTSPTGYTYYRRLGNFYNDASSNISEVVNDEPVTKAYYDSGWFSVSTDTTYTKDHNLNTTNLLCTVYLSSSSTGESAVSVMGNAVVSGAGAYGAVLGTLTSKQYTLGTGDVALSLQSYYGITSITTSGYARVILEVL